MTRASDRTEIKLQYGSDKMIEHRNYETRIETGTASLERDVLHSTYYKDCGISNHIFDARLLAPDASYRDTVCGPRIWMPRQSRLRDQQAASSLLLLGATVTID